MSGRFRTWASLPLMLASGFAGLGYQIVWTRQCEVWLGHEAAAILAVIAGFFGGIAAGSWILGARAARSTGPARWYAGCELVIGLWSLLLVVVVPAFSQGMLRLTGAAPSPLWQWTVAFSGTFVLLLPATAAMGATLPAMARITAAFPGGERFIAALYAANTLGATLGVLAAAFVLVPGFGLARTAMLCATLNLLCSAAALGVFRLPAPAASPPPPSAAVSGPARGVLAKLGVTGLLGIGYEVVVVRVLSQVTENTVYTFAVLLAVYLVGTAAGAAAYHRSRWAREAPGLDEWLVCAVSVACLFGTATLWGADALRNAALERLDGGARAALLAEAAPSLVSFGPPTFAMGALFSHLCRRADEAGVGLGKALAVNTSGAALAPALFGVVLPPAIGPKWTLLLLGAGYLALLERGSRFSFRFWGPAAAAALLAFSAPALAFVEVPSSGRLVSYRDGVMAAVSVVEDAGGVARLRINNRAQEGSSATERVDARQAWLPLLLHPAPRTVLFLGLGTGVTASSAAEDATLQVDAVELLPEVIEASSLFTARLLPRGASRLRVVAADARHHVRAEGRSYDVVVADNVHPARSGAGLLYTVEHFEAVALRLAGGGLFCQWLPLHQLDRETLRSIVRSFRVVYPQSWAILASNSLTTPVVGLVGRRDAGRLEVEAVRARLDRAPLRERLAGLGFEDELAVLGSFVAGPAALDRFAEGAEANTDDRPVVEYAAPRATYAPDSSPADRLIALLAELSVDPAELLSASTEPAWARRLAAYWAARDRFVESGRHVRPSPRVEEMLAQVRGPLLSVLRQSPDFRPAYDPLLSMATALARTDASGAHALLTELTRIQPARDEARRTLAQIDSSISGTVRR